MFQAETFDIAKNDHELGLAESIGMNTVRSAWSPGKLQYGWSRYPSACSAALDHRKDAVDSP